jgi:transcription factor TFIIIB component B''
LRHRSPTPEDAEEQKVDPSQVTMGDLVKDLRIGRKFSRHDELLERQRMKKLKSKMAGGIPGGAGSNDAADSSGSAGGSKAGTPGPAHHEAGESSSSAAAAAARPLTDGAPQFQIIDGQIVVNQSTRQFDRHAAAAREAGDLEEEIEDDFTHHTTSNTYMKRQQKPNHWTAIETETFYRGLRMFGTDFALLCKMFPGKNRRHVKLKFNREERAHPAKVNAALVGVKTVGIDLDEYKSHTGLEYKSVDEIEAEQARVEEEFEAEQRRAEEQAAAEAKKRQEELFGKKEEVEKKGKGRGRRKKEGGGMGLGF